MHQHVKKIKNTLCPFIETTAQTNFAKGVTNATLKTALDNLATMYLVSPIWALARMVSLYSLVHRRIALF
jgi:hypothetical protein